METSGLGTELRASPAWVPPSGVCSSLVLPPKLLLSRCSGPAQPGESVVLTRVRP